MYLFLCISAPICKKTHCSSNGIYSFFFSFFRGNVAFVAIMVWLSMVSTSVLLQLHSLLSTELNNKRSSTFLTWGQGSHYLKAFHNIIHMFFLKRTWSKLCVINSLEKMFCWKKFQYSSRTFSNFSLPGLFQDWIFIFDYFHGFQAFSSLCGNPGREASSISGGQGVSVFPWADFPLSTF